MIKILKTYRSHSYDSRPLHSIIKYVIIHYTELNFNEAISRLCDPQFKVSAHYIIKNSGEVYNLVDDSERAWHAGVSYWRGERSLNDNSIGIELDNSGKGAFDDIQINALTNLCKFLKKKYRIKLENFIGHSDVAPNRKIDPGIFFPWRVLATNNIGKWPNLSQKILTPKILFKINDYGDEVLSLQQSLCKLGYNILPTGIFDKQTNDVVRAFQAKYNPEFIKGRYNINDYFNLDSIYEWSDYDAIILKNLTAN